MPSRVGYVGTAVDGDVYTVANLAREPGGWLGFVSVSADQTGITTEVDLTGLTVTVTAAPNRLVKITATLQLGLDGPDGTDIWVARLYEDATVIQQLHGHRNWTTAGAYVTHQLIAVRPLDDVAATYKLTLARVTPSGTVFLEGTGNPNTLLVEDIGPEA